MTTKRERDAIGAFLSDMKHAREARRRLFERAREEPERILLYLDSLPYGVEARDELLRRLRAIANDALMR